MLNNVIGDCPKQCDVKALDFMDDYRKDLFLNLSDGEKSGEVYAGQDGEKGIQQTPCDRASK